MCARIDRDASPAILRGIDAVCFDAFGTLVEISKRRNPYIALLRSLEPRNRKRLKERLMRSEKPLEGLPVPHEPLETFEADLACEVASVQLRSGVEALWGRLREHGLRIGVCSNLEAPYGSAVLRALPDAPDAVVFSYEVGAIKPDPAIYRAVCAGLGNAEMGGLPGTLMAPSRILFTGDFRRADVDGPKAYGMKAMLIGEFEKEMAG